MINTKHNDSLVYFGYGASQPNRLLNALLPDYVNIDDRKLQDLLAFVANFAKNLRYYDKLNRPMGEFHYFLINDISVYLSLIISTDTDKIENKFNQILNNYYTSANVKNRKNEFIEMCNHIFSMINTIDEWFLHIRKINIQLNKIETIVENELHNIIIEKTRENVQYFKTYILGGVGKQVFQKSDFDFDFNDLSEIWRLDEVEGVNIFKGDQLVDQLNSALMKIRMTYRQIFHSIQYIILNFNKYFYRSINEKNNHFPHIGLLISFLKLYRYAQIELNEMTHRVLYFYYNTVLKQQQRDGICDHVHVYFNLANHVQKYTLPAGTSLIAGVSKDGSDICYETIRDVELTNASIKALKTLYVSRLDEVDTSDYQIVTAMYAAPIANSYDGNGGVFDYPHQSWALFGEEQEFKPSDTVNMNVADIGFAIASPILFLKEGERKVKLTLHFDIQSTKSFKKLLVDIQKKENQYKEIHDLISLEEVFYTRIFNQGDSKRNIKIFLTGEDKWIKVRPDKIAIKAVGDGDWNVDPMIEQSISILNSLEISFVIDQSYPSVTTMNTIINDEEYDSEFPILKILLDDSKQPFSYTFLQHLKIKQIEINVDVDRVRQVDIYNDFGVLDARHPFYPFGYQPKIDSAFIFGNQEMNRKALKSVKIQLDWKDLPNTVTAFKKYYAGYGIDIQPNVFKIAVSALVNGSFQPEMSDESDWVPLFEIDVAQDAPINISTINLNEIDLKNLGIFPDYYYQNANTFDQFTQSGYFKFELKSPEFAFGHEVYPKVFSQTLMQKMKDNESLDFQINLPYTPLLKNISLSYSAHCQFDVLYNLDDNVPEKIYHIHPFGVVNTYKFGSSRNELLLPDYVDEGHLFIGLDKVNAPESISILFQLSSKNIATHRNIPELPKISWYYLNINEQWSKLNEQQIYSDTTDGFTKTGIVSIEVPKDITNKSSMISKGLYWICVSINENTNVLCSAIGVYAQAVEAVRNQKYLEEYKEPLKPYEINQLLEPKSEIKLIVQPFESFHGRRIENRIDFFARVSERLRHKQRAVTHWDYERIILEQFADVQQVKCLSALSNPVEDLEAKDKIFINIEEEEAYIQGINDKEGVLLVVVPKMNHYFHEQTPNFNLKMLKQIEEFLMKISTPFVSLKVRNPLYEFVRIIANVKFKSNENQSGLLLKQLYKDIQKFITPWFFDSNIPISIGGYISETSIKDYIKTLPYIQFVTKFSMLHIIEEDGIFKVQDTAEETEFVPIIQARPWGILIADTDHEIEIIYREEEEAPQRRVNSESVIRFQNRVNILGGQKYVKIKNPYLKRQTQTEKTDTIYTVNFKI